MPDLSQDQNELISLLISHGVDFLVFDAHALARHVELRFTEDIDLWLKPANETGPKLRAALLEFGLTISESDASTFSDGDKMIRIGAPPFRVDLLNNAK